MIELWSKHLGPQALLPLTALLLAWLVKGMFTLHRSRSQDRKDFLDLWIKRDQADDLWLQVAVRHVYGEYLPSAVLRHLIHQPQGARALNQLSDAWALIDWDDVSGQLFWRNPRYFSKARRVLDYWLSLLGYFLMAALTLAGFWLVFAGYARSSWVEWTYLMAGLGVTAHLLAKQDRLKTANEVVPRWLGRMPWQGGGCDHARKAGEAVHQRRMKKSNKRNRGAR